MVLSPILQLVYIIVVSTICQILGWRTKIPAILLLLLVGIVSGPIFGLIQPEELFGATLSPMIELAVAIILFEGGLSLSKTEMMSVGHVVVRLVSITSFVTWSLLSALGYFLLGLNGVTSLLLGAILVISGPTVVTPLLRLIRAKAPVEPILRWEGILIDPIGVLLATLVAEGAEAGLGASTPWILGMGMAFSLVVGITLAYCGSVILRIVVGRHLIPDHYDVPLTLATLFTMVTISNLLHEQSGLMTATLMGLLVSRNKGAWVKSIHDFIGHTEMIVIGVLFVVLAAKLNPAHLQYFNFKLGVFVVLAIGLVRPVAVYIGTLGLGLKKNDRMALAALAPRGIVSAALASTLGAKLVAMGVPGADYIVPYTFATIIVTVAFYALSAPIVFSAIKVRQPRAEGVLFMGGGWNFSLALGKLLEIEGFKVTYVDTNEANIRRFRKFGMSCIYGNALSDSIKNEIDYDGIGNLIAFTSNQEANSLAAAEFRPIFGSAHVFQLAFPGYSKANVGGRILCNDDFTIEKIEELWGQGYRLFCREIIEPGADERDDKPKNTHEGEFVIAEIDKGNKLYLMGKDRLRRASRPTKQLVFGREMEVSGSDRIEA